MATLALKRALNGVFGGDARGSKYEKKTSTIGTRLKLILQRKSAFTTATWLNLPPLALMQWLQI